MDRRRRRFEGLPAGPPRKDRTLERVFWESYEEFLSKERENILNGVAERNLCGRWAHYMEPLAHRAGFTAYYADADYNRKQNGRVKTILDSRRHEIIRIVADLILHSRGNVVARDNLVAVEMKKSDRPESEKNEDRKRLRTMTKSSYDGVWSADGKTLPEHVCGYELGYFVELNIGKRAYSVQEFRKGEMVADRSGHF